MGIIIYFLFLRILRCFSSPGSLLDKFCLDITTLLVMGCPIWKSLDLSLLSNSPKLIAGYHVLLRLLVPRHPPYTLNNLLFCKIYICVQFSKKERIKIYLSKLSRKEIILLIFQKHICITTTIYNII